MEWEGNPPTQNENHKLAKTKLNKQTKKERDIYWKTKVNPSIFAQEIKITTWKAQAPKPFW